MTKPSPNRWDHNEWQSKHIFVGNCDCVANKFIVGESDGPGKYNSAMGGFINGIDTFDPLEFGISMNEAQHMDPSLRFALEVAHQVGHFSSPSPISSTLRNVYRPSWTRGLIIGDLTPEYILLNF